jgi:glycosyltransferase 2 family protein
VTRTKKKRIKKSKPENCEIHEQQFNNSNILRIALSLAVSIILLFFVMRGFDLKETSKYVIGLDPSLILLSILTYYSSYIVRAIRWRAMVEKAGAKITFSLSISTIFSSFAMNCVLPAKAGDIYRAYVADKTAKLGFFTVLGTVVAERVVDLATVMCAFLITFLLIFPSEGMNEFLRSKLESSVIATLIVSATVIAVIVLVVIYIDFFIKLLIPAKHKLRVAEVKRGFSSALTPLLVVITSTIAIWILEFSSFVLGVASAKSSVGTAQSAFTAVASTLSNAVPFTPGGLGAFELAARELLVLFKMTIDEALAVIFVLRLINYWGLIVVGSIFVLIPLIKQHGDKSPKKVN